jgi:hypothetical protein
MRGHGLSCEGDGAALESIAHKPVTVGGRPRNGDKQIPGLDRPRIGRNAGDIDVRISIDRFLLKGFDQR